MPNYLEKDGEIVPSYAPDGNGNHPYYSNRSEEPGHDFTGLHEQTPTQQPVSEREQPEWQLSEAEKQVGRVGVAGARQILQEARRKNLQKPRA